MRIICTVTNDLAQDQRMDRICTSLAQAGHVVTLIGRKLPSSKPLNERPYQIYRIPCRNHSGKAFYLEYNWRLWRTLRKWEFDAICAVDLDTLVAGWLLKTGNRKLVYDAHEWFSETPEVVGRPLVRFIWRQVGKWLVPRTDARYTVAPMLAGKLAEEYGVPFGTVRNLPLRKSSTEKPNNQLGPKVILYQGMFNPGRGLEVAIEAMQWLPDCKLLLVGDGPELGALRRCSEKNGVQGRVEFAGFRPPEELPEITRQAWLGLNLLDARSPSYYYSLANKALDYVQAGLPSVQMDFPEYRALNEAHGCYLLLDQLDAKLLAKSIQQLIDRPKRYE
ncbi:MAG: glycosyltransferase family 4 protein, partial [Bacteroidota bacterium]